MTTTGEVIHPAHVVNTKKFAADHSKLPHAKGGPTVPDNGKIETHEYNTDKSDKVVATG